MVDFTFSLYGFERFLLIFVRITTFVFVAPIFSQRGTPNMTKIGFSGLLAYLVYMGLNPPEASYVSEIGYAILVLKEATTGLLIGFAGNICEAIILFAGNLIDMDIGLSMVSEFDPSMNTQVTITAQIYNYAFMLMLLATNMHQHIIRALTDSFVLIPLGGAEIDTEHLLLTFIRYMGDLFELAFRIMLPVFATILVVNCVLGIMAKVAPQMNMFTIGIQIKVMAGLAVMLILVFLFPEVVQIVYDRSEVLMREMAEGLY